MDLQVSGKTALVTGSTAGIGLAIAKTLAQEGAEVIINGRNKERVEALVQHLSKELPGTRFRGIAADFSKVEEVNALLAALPEVDILINNVGVFEPKEFADIPDEDWFRFFEVNVLSGVRLSRHYFPKMLAKNWGRIIFVSSESALQIPTEMIHYGTTKTAQLAISRGLAELTTGTEVTVNTVLPGPTFSEGVGDFIGSMAARSNVSVEEMEQDFFKNARPTSIIKRFATTQEIANMVAYLVSPLASATNGAAIRVDGGVTKTIA
ncbi:NAD(P)-dependent dehydrogenase (short-subunit alcohol dehydrogenase family) [Larkinella arboricola]|uniref:NAD(P)-dependent dehydrogenase (Short-subunit alcohol dehydrogenase family) n=1 Tax=Larkinella arboricola TaxID=643671 RepID=A0A327WW89_LARAB|nr:SDR family oxidoreductase [Larkinella arboricola]RAJ95966.1 NAD(P)-dependent dehydrogenase (short-subunit alcohol dehydrogenase family) [Larkinella arboricola]